MIPPPCLRIDRLTHRAKNPQTGNSPPLHPCLPFSHQRPDGRRCSIEYAHLISLHDLPESSGLRIGGNTFKHQRGRPKGKGSVYDIAMARHPSDIGCAEEDIFVLQIKDPLQRLVDKQEIASCRYGSPPLVCLCSHWCKE